jgi:hypothetical protein
VALYSNTLYAVNITASGSVGGCLSAPCPLQTGDAQAFTDPSFMIDPSTPGAGGYSIVFSPGIASVPDIETSTGLLIGLAFSSLVFARKRVRGQHSTAV